jgi:hypothetical protein
MMARARKHQAQAALRDPRHEQVACLLGLLDKLCREYAAEHSRERAEHLADAILDLETMIVRAILLAKDPTPLEPG